MEMINTFTVQIHTRKCAAKICSMCTLWCMCVCVHYVGALQHTLILHIEKCSHWLAFSLSSFMCVYVYLNRPWHVLSNAFQMKCGGMMNRTHRRGNIHTLCVEEVSLLLLFFAAPTFCFPILHFLVSGEFFSTDVTQMHVCRFTHLFDIILCW